ncbi:hypothetical protein D3C79_521760 [compost metagenome]
MLAVHIQPRACAAHLALVEEDRRGRTGCGFLQVGVGHDDGRRLAAQFQGDAGHVVHGRLADQLADLGGAGEGQFVYAGVAAERGAGVQAGTGNHVEHAGWVAGLVDQLGQLEHAQWGFIGRLEHHGAAGGQCRAELPAGQQQWEVPGNDGAHHAHCLAAHEAVELVDGHQRHGRFDGATLDLGGPARHIAQEVDGQLHVHHLGHGGALAIVQAFQFGQLTRIALHQVGQAPQQVLPLARAHAAPGRVVEGLSRSAHGAVDIFGLGGRHFTQHLAGGRVAERQGATAGGVLPVGADAHLQLAFEKGAGGGQDGQFGKHGAVPLVIGCDGHWRNGRANLGRWRQSVVGVGFCLSARLRLPGCAVAH